MITYAFLASDKVGSIDFEAVNETAASTLRYSLDARLTFVHWNGERPEFLSNIDCEIVTSDEALQILEGSNWIDKTRLVRGIGTS
jgi:hypothetical protein